MSTGLWQSLGNLEQRLRVAVTVARGEPAWRPEPLLASCQVSLFPPLDNRLADERFEKLNRLRAAYHLSEFDADVVVTALAVHADMGFSSVYAFLLDNPNATSPSVGLILDLLSTSPHERAACRASFASGGPLRSHGLVRLGLDDLPFPLRPVELDAHVADFLLGSEGIDERLRDVCELIPPSKQELPEPLRTIPATLKTFSRDRRPLVLYLRGATSSRLKDAAAALGGRVRATVLAVDLNRAAQCACGLPQALELIRRDSTMRDSIRFFAGVDEIRETEHFDVFRRHLARMQGVVLIGGGAEWQADALGPSGVVTIDLGAASWDERRSSWRTSLAGHGFKLREGELDTLATSFRLSTDQIRDASAAAGNYVLLHQSPPEAVVKEVFRAARSQTGQELSKLTRRIEPIYGWNDLVLPADSLAQLRELCRRVSYRETVLKNWGFGKRHSSGKGANALFAGGSGTGKTMAAEVIGTELQLSLFKIDLAGVVSKYIGETEKNLDKIFAAATDADAILFFDEADALFGKRSEVRDSHDRYANLEISYLLQKMEEYQGIAILATNLKQNMDDAFVRRLAFTIGFPFPDAAMREQIWRRVWPAELPCADDVDFGLLAENFPLSGGNIRNIVLAAAFEAAAEPASAVAMRHLLHATRREHQKLGKPLLDSEIPESLTASSSAGRAA
jgi:ATPases of the AAA+ class